MNKWFSLVNIDAFDFCNLKTDPNISIILQDKYKGVKSAYHMDKKNWISVHFNKDIPNETIKELIKTSYILVVNSFTKKEREEHDSI